MPDTAYRHRHVTVGQLADRVERLERKVGIMATEEDQLSTDVDTLTTAFSNLKSVTDTALADFQSEIDQLKAGNPSIAPQLAKLEQVLADAKAEAAEVTAKDPGAPSGV